MFIGAGAFGCCADAIALEAKIARATAAGPRQRVQILADQHVIDFLLLYVVIDRQNKAILGGKIAGPT
jgi:hypothetical protein